jgi:hypothetical protein
MTVTKAMTLAKTGRSMKNFDIIAARPGSMISRRPPAPA